MQGQTNSVEALLPDLGANEAAGDKPARNTAPCWHIITCEFPPQSGGVSDYTSSIAKGLAGEGERVHVWCPGPAAPLPQVAGVVAHPELGRITSEDLHRVGKLLDQFPAPRRILVQWVPHGYGYRSMNLRFCWWLNRRVHGHGDRLQIMVHEAYLSFRARSLRQSAVAFVHRLMTMLLMGAAERVWVSIPRWEDCFRPYALGRKVPFQWLPVPSNVALNDDPAGIRTVRQRYVSGDGVLIGHFGTYGWPITSILEPLLLELGREPVSQTILLMGIGSEEFRRTLVQKEPRLEAVLRATGSLADEDLSRHISACDLLMQPYPDGVSGRRTSFMAGLSHGKPVVTTLGRLSEDFWKSADIVPLAPVGDQSAFLALVRRLRGDESERVRLGEAARQLYRQRFDLQYTISSLRSAARGVEEV
jgi:glycosyltransferase involved in cell wall biosynthesis